MVTALAMRHGSHAHMESALFRDPGKHANDLDKIAAELGKSSEPFVVHYRNQYDEPSLPPIWAIVETMTLGTLSRWFKNTCETAAKKGRCPGLEHAGHTIHKRLILCNMTSRLRS